MKCDPWSIYCFQRSATMRRTPIFHDVRRNRYGPAVPGNLGTSYPRSLDQPIGVRQGGISMWRLVFAAAAIASVGDDEGFVKLFTEDGPPKGWRVTEWNDVAKDASKE